MNLEAGDYLISFQHACRTDAALADCGMVIFWGGSFIDWMNEASDYEIHTYTFVYPANLGDKSIVFEESGVINS